MKFEFDHTHYVPVLRWKRGERVALRELTYEVRSRITPLLELVHTKNDSPAKISDDVRKDWGPAPFFLDDINFSESDDSTTVGVMNEAMRFHGLLSIPVTGISKLRPFDLSCCFRSTERSEMPTGEEICNGGWSGDRESQK